jgi:hypothetical protein
LTRIHLTKNSVAVVRFIASASVAEYDDTLAVTRGSWCSGRQSVNSNQGDPMSTKTLYLAIVAAAAAAPAAHAMPSPVPHLASGVVLGDNTAPRLSDAARDQILGSPNLYLAAKTKPFGQAGNPWMQSRWVGQMRLPGK